MGISARNAGFSKAWNLGSCERQQEPIRRRHRDILAEMLMRVAMRRDFMTSGDRAPLYPID